MEKFKNIINLSKLFIKENNKIDIIDSETGNLNKRSVLFWTIIILFIGISYISYELVYYLSQASRLDLFLNGYFLFLEILLIFETIMLSTNIFYFSKDIEKILPLPFKPIEILIAKFNTLISFLYGTELIFAVVPFIFYGIYSSANLLFYINLFLVLIIFPIFIALIISVVVMFLMKAVKIFKSKELMQTMISVVLCLIIFSFLGSFLNFDFEFNEELLDIFNEKIIEINNYFLTINPSIKILTQNNILKIILYFLELILINFVGFSIFIFFGNKFYLKQLLKNSFYIKNKKNKKIKLNKKCKKRNISFSYIKKEFKMLFKNPQFFIQGIYYVVLLTFVASVFLIAFIPPIKELFYMEEYKEMLEGLEFDFEAVCLILGLIQVIGLFNYSSVTAFSREGQNAYVGKYLPINLYKQLIYKNIPQIFINTILSIPILAIIAYEIPAIKLGYIFIIFGFNFLFTCINSFILTVIDLVNPNLNWKAEYEVFKSNKNKLLQYVLIIINIIFLYYFDKLLIDYSLNTGLIVFFITLLLIFIIINVLICKFKNKLFRKIN